LKHKAQASDWLRRRRFFGGFSNFQAMKPPTPRANVCSHENDSGAALTTVMIEPQIGHNEPRRAAPNWAAFSFWQC